MKSQTHLEIDAALCGEIVSLSEGQASVRLTITAAMGVDARGLAHGSFAFGAADSAAMLAVNDPNVVLGGADVRFLAPVVAGDVVDAAAQVTEEKGKKRVIAVSAKVGEREVLSGTLTAFVLPTHVLDA